MDNEKKYEEALERAKSEYQAHKSFNGFREMLVHIFPELAESEDEKIRKELIKFVKVNIPNEERYIAWLEKQESVEEIVARCKTSWYNEGKIAGMAEGLTNDEKYQQGWHDALEKQSRVKQAMREVEEKAEAFTQAHKGETSDEILAQMRGEQKPANKVEPKFKVGDWIIKNDDSHINIDYICCEITKIENGNYTIESIYGYKGYNTFETFEKDYHLWTIQDAKDGDVLATEDENLTSPFIAIYKSLGGTEYYGLKDDLTFNSHCFIGFDGIFYKGEQGHVVEGAHPATKEQRDLFFQKMKESGYTWDSKKKELREIEEELTDFENSLKHIMIETIECGDTRNLKADAEMLLRIAQKPKEWSEEDIHNMENIDSVLFYDKDLPEDTCVRLRNWLKSLKPQKQWKPSDEQMKTLHDLNLTGNISYAGQGQVLIDLYNDLKKLTE